MQRFLGELIGKAKCVAQLDSKRLEEELIFGCTSCQLHKRWNRQKALQRTTLKKRQTQKHWTHRKPQFDWGFTHWTLPRVLDAMHFPESFNDHDVSYVSEFKKMHWKSYNGSVSAGVPWTSTLSTSHLERLRFRLGLGLIPNLEDKYWG